MTPSGGFVSALRRLYASEPVEVREEDNRPAAVAGVDVDAVREEWLVEDRWWTGRPLERHYFEMVLVDGRDVTVFRSARSDRWYRQRA